MRPASPSTRRSGETRRSAFSVPGPGQFGTFGPSSNRHAGDACLMSVLEHGAPTAGSRRVLLEAANASWRVAGRPGFARADSTSRAALVGDGVAAAARWSTAARVHWSSQPTSWCTRSAAQRREVGVDPRDRHRGGPVTTGPPAAQLREGGTRRHHGGSASSLLDQWPSVVGTSGPVNRRQEPRGSGHGERPPQT